jgi:phosphatidate cytidylyltransferase
MLKQRLLTAIIAVILLLTVLFVAPPLVARLVIAALFVAAAWEWSGFLGLQAMSGRLLYVAVIAAAEFALWQRLPDSDIYLLASYAAGAWWLTALVWLFLFPTRIPKPIAWVCGALVLLPAYIAVDWLYLQSPLVLLSMLLIVWLADIGAYFSGRRFGRVKLAPAISPGKSWEGVFGGLLVVSLATIGTAIALSLDVLVVFPFCAAVALLSVVGDLTVSMFKRHAGVKDSGSLFPGHGGILDRIDSVCAAAPLFAAGLIALGLR